MTPPGGPAPPGVDDVLDAMRKLQINMLSYHAALQQQAYALQQAGRVDDALQMQSLADQVNIAESSVAEALGRANAEGLQQDLASLAAGPVAQLQTIIDTIDEKTKALNREEAVVKWITGLASSAISVVLAPGPGALAAAIASFAALLGDKPA